MFGDNCCFEATLTFLKALATFVAPFFVLGIDILRQF